jgi:uncharacterized membrane protein YjjP (DUF1212 family)
MDGGKILGSILDIGVELIRSGAETSRVEDSLYRLADAYGFRDANIWVVPTNIQATAADPAGETLTQIRHVRAPGVNFDRLDRLNDLCRRACAETPEEDELRRRLEEVLAAPGQRPWLMYLAGVLAGAGFGVFFNCDWLDALVAVCASLLITFLGRRLGRRESNPMILNFLISFLAELFILLSVRLGFGHHRGYITVGVVMLLISALGTTNGVRDLVHLDTLSGLMNITSSLTGAAGIAMGIALPLLLFRRWGDSEIMVLNPSVPLELAAATAGCVGFAIWFGVERAGQIGCCAVGALLTWSAYLFTYRYLPNAFAATLFAAVACALFAQAMARLNKAPATIFQTVSVFPLIPGAALYYAMYGLVMRDGALAAAKGKELLLACFGIVLGFMAVEVAVRSLRRSR